MKFAKKYVRQLIVKKISKMSLLKISHVLIIALLHKMVPVSSMEIVCVNPTGEEKTVPLLKLIFL